MKCAHFGECGGCSIQDLPYEDQLAAKEAIVRKHLEGLEIGEFGPIIPSPTSFYYRNKMEYSFGDEKDLEILSSSRPSEARAGIQSLRKRLDSGSQPSEGLVRNDVHLGLHPKGRFAVVTPTPECLLQSEESQRILAITSTWARERKVPVYVRKNGEGDLRHLVIREGKNTSERMVNLVAKSKTEHVDDLAQRLHKSGVPIQTFIWTAHDGISDVVMGDVEKIYWGEGFIHERMGGLAFRVAPASFFQTNTQAFEVTLQVLKAWVRHDTPSQNAKLFDIYCGCGSIGLNLASVFKEVIGIELNDAAIANAIQNASLNGITNASFMAGRAEDLLPRIHQSKDDPITVVVDPPRAGLHPQVKQTLLRWLAPRIYYISCNPESLGRDLRALGARYRILTVQPMDFFPHTNHIETAVRLELKP